MGGHRQGVLQASRVLGVPHADGEPPRCWCGHVLCTGCYAGIKAAADAAVLADNPYLPQEAFCPMCRAPLISVSKRASPTVRGLMMLRPAYAMPYTWTTFRIPIRWRQEGEVVVSVSQNGKHLRD